MKLKNIVIQSFMSILLLLILTSCRKHTALSVPIPEMIMHSISNMDGQIQLLETPPNSVELNELVNDTVLFVFPERQNHKLSKSITTDLSEPGEYFSDDLAKDKQTWESLNPSTIEKGTIVSSYYFHYDNETYDDGFTFSDYFGCEGQLQVNSSITFDRPILGVIMRAGLGTKDHLRRSDGELGWSDVDYCEHNLSHFPGINIADGCQSDRFILSEDRLTLFMRNNTDIHHDNFRVVIEGE